MYYSWAALMLSKLGLDWAGSISTTFYRYSIMIMQGYQHGPTSRRKMPQAKATIKAAGHGTRRHRAPPMPRDFQSFITSLTRVFSTYIDMHFSPQHSFHNAMQSLLH